MSAPIEFESDADYNARCRRAAGLNNVTPIADAPKEADVVQPAVSQPLTPFTETEKQWSQRMVREQQDRERAGTTLEPSPSVEAEPHVETLEEFKSKCADHSPRVQPNKRIAR